MSEEARSEEPGQEAPHSAEAPAEEWYVSVDGENRMGPMSAGQVKEMIKEGKLGGEAVCWQEGFADWAALRTVEEFSAALAEASPKTGETMAKKAKGGWSVLKSALKKGADEAAKKAKKAHLRLKISSVRKNCDKVFLGMGKALHEKGEAFLADESYAQQRGQADSLQAQIRELQQQIDELD